MRSRRDIILEQGLADQASNGSHSSNISPERKMTNRALIFAVAAQNGAYLAECLPDQGYYVHGIKGCSSLVNTHRNDHLYRDPGEKVSLTPEYTDTTDALGLLRFLEAIRIMGLEDKIRFYQVPSSEIHGMVQEIAQSYKTPFCPRSTFAMARLYAYCRKLSCGIGSVCGYRTPLCS